MSGSDAFIWDAVTGEKLLMLRGHANDIYTVAFSPDGTMLATGGGDRKLKVWDAASGAELFTLSGHGGSITGVAFSPDGTLLAVGLWDNTVQLSPATAARLGVRNEDVVEVTAGGRTMRTATA